MKYPLTKNLLLSAILLASGNSYADWTGGITAGTTLGSTNPSLRFYADSQSEPLNHHAYLDWIRSSGGSNYRLGYKPKFKVSHSVYSFGNFSIEEDNPNDIDREIDALVGIGNNLFQRGNTQVKVEAGLGARLLQFDNSDKNEEGFVFLSGDVSSSSLPFLRLNLSGAAKAGSDQTTLDVEAALSVPIGPGTALSYVYNIKKYNIDGQPNIDSDDSSFKITYGF